MDAHVVRTGSTTGPRLIFLAETAAAALVSNALICAVTWAQDNSNDPPESTAIEEIVVTATRREQPLQSVPLSVHVVTKEELRQLGAVAFADYARTVPGMSFTDGGTSGEKQTIRGISASPWFEVI